MTIKGDTNDIPMVEATTVSAEPEINVPAEPKATAVSSAPIATATTTTTTTYTVPPPAQTTNTGMVGNVNLGNLGRSPARITCPYCKKSVITRTAEMADAMTLVAVIVLLFVFWPIFWLPLCLPSCKATEHYCTSCNRRVGKLDACS